MSIKILFISDVFGRPGRRALQKLLPVITAELSLDLVVANGENAAGGRGITTRAANELFSAGVHVITSGNHVWRHREITDFIQTEPRLLRPANYPANNPGSGYIIYSFPSGPKIGIINLEGRIFMNNCLDDPFRVALAATELISRSTRLIIVDFHAEASSEKRALGWYLAGKISALIGTHTHVQTADEQILPGGTGYITDAGLSGARESVIGLECSSALDHFLTQMPIKFRVAKEDVQLQGVFLELDSESGKCLRIERISRAG